MVNGGLFKPEKLQRILKDRFQMEIMEGKIVKDGANKDRSPVEYNRKSCMEFNLIFRLYVAIETPLGYELISKIFNRNV